MKNIHLIPSSKPSRLYLNSENKIFITDVEMKCGDTQNICITNDEEIKIGDYWIYICPITGLDYGDNDNPIVRNNLPNSWFEKLHDKSNYKKIILTTDLDLIKDGVQEINDEFLQWFVNNPSCETVEIESKDFSYDKEYWYTNYKIIIPKQETLEEAAERCFEEMKVLNPKGGIKEFIRMSVNFGAKWKQERNYSEEEVLELLKDFNQNAMEYIEQDERNIMTSVTLKKWFEQFKKK